MSFQGRGVSVQAGAKQMTSNLVRHGERFRVSFQLNFRAWRAKQNHATFCFALD